MPYAKDNRISKSHIEGGVEITDAKYRELMGLLTGKDPDHKGFEIRDGKVFKLKRTERTVYNIEDHREHKIPENSQTPEGYADNKPGDYDYWDGTQWVEDSKAKKAAERDSATLSRAEFKLALLERGELDSVKAAMESPDADPRAVILWEDANTFHRTNDDLMRLASDLGYTEADLDDIYGIGA